MKVICAGIGKTGTTSLAKALKILGLNVYEYQEHCTCHMNEWLNLFDHGNIPDFKLMYQDVDACVDSPPNMFYEEILQAFPDAKVILTVREENAWLNSLQDIVRVDRAMTATVSGLIFRIASLITRNGRRSTRLFFSVVGYNFGTCNLNLDYIIKKRYREHNDRVKAVVPAEKLLVFDVREGWGPLCGFLGVEKPSVPFPFQNVKNATLREWKWETENAARTWRQLAVIIVGTATLAAATGFICFRHFRP